MEFIMENQFKEDLELAITQLAANGPAPDDVIRDVVGIGKVVIKSKWLPSGLILEPSPSIVNHNLDAW
jgi:hypothetical protein